MIEETIRKSEDAELIINSSGSGNKSSLSTRRQSGSFYTPSDAAKSLWLNLLHCQNIKRNKDSILAWVRRSRFIDPSSGSGIFLFSLLQLLQEFDIKLVDVHSELHFTCIDINKKATKFLDDAIADLFQANDLSRAPGVDVINTDGVSYLKNEYNDSEECDRSIVIVGNPPYVRLKHLADSYTEIPGFRIANIYALFLFWSGRLAHRSAGAFGLIVPLSVTFSRHHVGLRNAIFRFGGNLHLAHFDNIPDSIFSAGKPDSENTNKANSQRVTFFCGNFSKINPLKIHSGKLISWKKSQRGEVLSTLPKTYVVNPIGPQKIIPKPSNLVDKKISASISDEGVQKIRDFTADHGAYKIWISATARNYISSGLDQFKDTSLLRLSFPTGSIAQSIFLLLSTQTFLDYWRCVGDGFHVTLSNLLDFPMLKSCLSHQDELAVLAINLWDKRHLYRKEKINAGIKILSYDFTTAKEVYRANQLIKSAIIDE